MAGSKLYKVTDIDFWNLTIKAVECDLDVCDVPKEEIFDVEDFREFRVTLRNEGDMGKIVDLSKWKMTKKCRVYK